MSATALGIRLTVRNSFVAYSATPPASTVEAPRYFGPNSSRQPPVVVDAVSVTPLTLCAQPLFEVKHLNTLDEMSNHWAVVGRRQHHCNARDWAHIGQLPVHHASDPDAADRPRDQGDAEPGSHQTHHGRHCRALERNGWSESRSAAGTGQLVVEIGRRVAGKQHERFIG